MSSIQRHAVLFLSFILGLTIVVGVAMHNQSDAPLLQRSTVVINDVVVGVDVADESHEQARGLGGREYLPDSAGMLFVFEDLRQRHFWMKDMLISIDIIWIVDNTIVGIAHEVQPEPGKQDYSLQVYSSPEPVNYVLEVRAGLAQEKGWEIGDTVIINR